MTAAIRRLQDIMAALRDPARGCPWDREQTWSSIAPHTLEEAYELADAIERGDAQQVRDELGDLLFQVVFQARIAEEQGLFDLDAVARAIADKLERRHPHVFGDAEIASAAEQSAAWEQHKAAERRSQGQPAGALAGVALGLPALTRAAKLGRRAGAVGFDWDGPEPVLAKVEEEQRELREARAAGDLAAVEEELGDLLFALAQFARHADLDPEAALRAACAKFERRFARMEQWLDEASTSAADCSPEHLERLWARAKREAG